MDQEIFELLLDLHKEVAIIRADQGSMKEDLREHIKRTALLEAELKRLHDQDIGWLKKNVYLAYGAIGFISFCIALYKSLRG
jgi:regulator of replication initiation timing